MIQMEPKKPKGFSHGLEEYYDFFWDECKSIHTEHIDSPIQQDVEVKAKEPEGGLSFEIPLPPLSFFS